MQDSRFIKAVFHGSFVSVQRHADNRTVNPEISWRAFPSSDCGKDAREANRKIGRGGRAGKMVRVSAMLFGTEL